MAADFGTASELARSAPLYSHSAGARQCLGRVTARAAWRRLRRGLRRPRRQDCGPRRRIRARLASMQARSLPQRAPRRRRRCSRPSLSAYGRALRPPSDCWKRIRAISSTACRSNSCSTSRSRLRSPKVTRARCTRSIAGTWRADTPGRSWSQLPWRLPEGSYGPLLPGKSGPAQGQIPVNSGLFGHRWARMER